MVESMAAAGSKIWQNNPWSSWVDWQKVVIWLSNYHQWIELDERIILH